MCELFIKDRDDDDDALMQSTIIHLIKNKSGNLSDVNNYTAIAISTAVTKLFESAIETYVVSDGEADMYQFGFKKQHYTAL